MSGSFGRRNSCAACAAHTSSRCTTSASSTTVDRSSSWSSRTAASSPTASGRADQSTPEACARRSARSPAGWVRCTPPASSTATSSPGTSSSSTTHRRRRAEARPRQRPGLLAEHERIAVGDLGLAKDQERTAAGPTIVGGTPYFRSPEQMRRGEEVGPEADVFGATAVLWNVLTGEAPAAAGRRGAAGGGARRLAVVPDARARAGAGTALLEHGRMGSRGARGARRRLEVARRRLPRRRSRRDVPVQGIGIVPARRTPRSSSGGRHSSTSWSRAPVLERPRHRWTVRQREVIAAPRRPRPRDRGRGAAREPARPAWSSVPGPIRSKSWRSSSRGSTPSAPRRSARDARRRSTQRARLLASGSGADRRSTSSRRSSRRSPNRRARDAFLEVLATLTRIGDAPLRVVIALRSDFYSAARGFPWLADRISDNQVLVGPMRRRRAAARDRGSGATRRACDSNRA